VTSAAVPRLAVEGVKGVSPDVSGSHRARDRTVLVRGQLEVVPRVVEVVFPQRRVAGMGEELVDAPPRHHVAAQERGDAGHGRSIARYGGIHDAQLGHDAAAW
jgi:hypothetical protein